MTKKSTVFGMLGVLWGSIVRVWKGFKSISNTWKSKRNSNGTSKNFVYEIVKSHSRGITKEKDYIMYRELNVRANVSGLSEMRIGVGPISDACYEVKSLTPSVKLDCIQTPSSDLVSDDYRVIFPAALSKGESLQYKIKIHAVAKNGRNLPQCFTVVKD